MKILSITIRGYRVHQDTTLELDPSRNLIGGPNESGKSTLIEAVHRALFLKSSVSGSAQKSMVSTLHGGQPEVEVRFSAGGATYRLAKRFSGSSGSTTLAAEGGGTLSGSEAEDRLAEVLGVEPVGGGRGVLERSASQWAHLWVKQGESAQNPSEQASKERDSLVARLKEEGGAAAMESELDSRVSRFFKERCDEIFKANSQPRTGSELAKAIQALGEARERLSAAQAMADRLRQAAEDFALSEKVVAEKSEKLAEVLAERIAARRRGEQIATLRMAEGEKRAHCDKVAAELKALNDTASNMAETSSKLHEKEARHRPSEAEFERCRTEVERLKEKRQKSSESCRLAEQRAKHSRLALERENARRRAFEREVELARLRAESDDIAKAKSEVADLEFQIARMPLVTREKFEGIKRFEDTLAKAEAALQAMAAGIEVIASKAAISIGEEPAPIGSSRVITEDTTVLVGDVAEIRVSPGGGISLAEARDRVEAARAALANSLEQLGLAAVPQAEEAYAGRTHLSMRLADKRAALAARKADEVEARLTEALREVETANAELARRTSAAPCPEGAPASLAEATRRAEAARDESERLEEEEAESKANLEAIDRLFRNASDRLALQRDSIDADRREMESLRGSLAALEKMYGSRNQVEENVRDKAHRQAEANAELAAIHEELQTLQPDDLDADLARIERAISQLRDGIETGRQTLAVSRSTLASDGNTDPLASLALAAAEVEAAEKERANAECQARAVQHLADLFREQQRELTHQFSRPLAEKITGYITQLFPGAEANTVLGESGFEQIVLTRDGRRFDFGELSGGTQEQVAAAFRLAIAETLAKDHDGCLPVVFDDAFTNTDPERIQVLQRMLDRGARQGLQIILLTCSPESYASLGAKSHSLKRTV